MFWQLNEYRFFFPAYLWDFFFGLFLIKTFFWYNFALGQTFCLQSCVSEPLIPQLCPWQPAPYTVEMWIYDVYSESGHILGCKAYPLKGKPLCCNCKPQQCPWERQHLFNAQVLGLFTIHAPCDATDWHGLIDRSMPLSIAILWHSGLFQFYFL